MSFGMRRIALINEKGGTGKTTLAVNVAAYFAQQKHLPVLLASLGVVWPGGSLNVNP